MDNILVKIAKNLVENFKDVLKDNKATGNLESKIKWSVGLYFVQIELPQYAEFLETGTKPHNVSPYVLKEWSEIRGVNPFAVAANIRKFGTKPHPWQGKVTKLMMNYDEEILNWMDIQITEFDKAFIKIWE